MLRVAEHFHQSDTGRTRPMNEDAVFARPPLFAVADGMGGAQAGEVASNAALGLFQTGLPDDGGSNEARLAGLVAAANSRVYALSQADAEKAGMGTTLTAAYLGEEDLAIAHVGDSRLYRFRAGKLEQRTDDHSLVGELVRRGELSPEDAEEHPQRSIITRALGPEGEVAVDHVTLDAHDGDVFLICSDGLTSMIGDGEIAAILAGADSLRGAGKALVRAANAAGGRDNISVVLFRVERVADGSDVVHDQATGVLATADLEAAAAAAAVLPGAEQAEPVQPRRPREPQAPPRPRSRWRSSFKALAVSLFVLLILLTGVTIAARSVYFVGTDDEGFVTLYQGLPYDLPLGISAYQKGYESGVSAATLPEPAKRTIAEHKLRSQDDAKDLIRQLEQGRVSGQR